MDKFLEHVNDKGVYQGPSTWEGNLYIRKRDRLTDLGTLEEVTGYLSIYKCHTLLNTGKLKEVGGYLDINRCRGMVSLPKLEKVGDDLCMPPGIEIPRLTDLDGFIYVRLASAHGAKQITHDDYRKFTKKIQETPYIELPALYAEIPSVMHGYITNKYTEGLQDTRNFRDFLDSEGVYQGPSSWHGSIEIFREDNLREFGGLRKVEGSVFINGCHHLKDFGVLATIRGSLTLEDCPILEDLSSITILEGNDYLPEEAPPLSGLEQD